MANASRPSSGASTVSLVRPDHRSCRHKRYVGAMRRTHIDSRFTACLWGVTLGIVVLTIGNQRPATAGRWDPHGAAERAGSTTGMSDEGTR
jgi:hypothetical protein